MSAKAKGSSECTYQNRRGRVWSIPIAGLWAFCWWRTLVQLTISEGSPGGLGRSDSCLVAYSVTLDIWEVYDQLWMSVDSSYSRNTLWLWNIFTLTKGFLNKCATLKAFNQSLGHFVEPVILPCQTLDQIHLFGIKFLTLGIWEESKRYAYLFSSKYM